MDIIKMIGIPGTPLSSAATARATAGRATGMSWMADNPSALLMAERARFITGHSYVENVAATDAGITDPVFIQVAVDQPTTVKPIHVPLPPRERSP
ncbi:hypothetical protein [Amycolatopsis nigrescens]|uniref:hypothetical protein n=1 Tax=Amycolatopsis nigrescens TaxID=381445 RepID=UPI000378B54F|nr:hypothetical protein [Amycolatopsis nigrescens]